MSGPVDLERELVALLAAKSAVSLVALQAGLLGGVKETIGAEGTERRSSARTGRTGSRKLMKTRIRRSWNLTICQRIQRVKVEEAQQGKRGQPSRWIKLTMKILPVGDHLG